MVRYIRSRLRGREIEAARRRLFEEWEIGNIGITVPAGQPGSRECPIEIDDEVVFWLTPLQGSQAGSINPN